MGEFERDRGAKLAGRKPITIAGRITGAGAATGQQPTGCNEERQEAATLAVTTLAGVTVAGVTLAGETLAEAAGDCAALAKRASANPNGEPTTLTARLPQALRPTLKARDVGEHNALVPNKGIGLCARAGRGDVSNTDMWPHRAY